MLFILMGRNYIYIQRYKNGEIKDKLIAPLLVRPDALDNGGEVALVRQNQSFHGKATYLPN